MHLTGLRTLPVSVFLTALALSFHLPASVWLLCGGQPSVNLQSDWVAASFCENVLQTRSAVGAALMHKLATCVMLLIKYSFPQ